MIIFILLSLLLLENVRLNELILFISLLLSYLYFEWLFNFIIVIVDIVIIRLFNWIVFAHDFIVVVVIIIIIIVINIVVIIIVVIIIVDIVDIIIVVNNIRLNK
jgi:hypothetical protein